MLSSGAEAAGRTMRMLSRESRLMYRSEHVQKALTDLKKKNPNAEASIMVDCSHGNSSKNHLNQPKVAEDVGKQIAAGETGIVGIM
jgi:3-deoxy-7-phosphoheptulonate synthase